MQTEKLSISLPAEMARMVRRRVEEGAYASNSELIRDALRVWHQREEEREGRLDAIRQQLEDAARYPQRHSDADVKAHFDALLAKVAKTGKP